MTRDTRICVAKIGAAHGVRGEVRLWPFTEDPMAVTRYGALSSKDGARTIEIVRSRSVKDHLIATLKDVSDRDAAARLNGIELYVERDALPPTDDGEYYHADLIGLRAIDPNGLEIGRIVALHNFGAGDIVEILPASGISLMLPFSDAVVPSVDLEAGTAVVIVPNEIDGED